MLRYVLVTGVGFWGTASAVLVTLITPLWGVPFDPKRLPVTLIMFWIAGIFWGLAMWFIVIRRKNREQP
jgi:heme/copper-type cytochrome/quinol oxidase subunit 2